MAQYRTIPIIGTATARAQTTLVSRRIDVPFVLETITARFPAGAANLLQLAFYASPDSEVPSSGNPTGVNLLQEFSTTPYLRGDGDQVTIAQKIPVAAAGTYLKVVATNADWYDHDVDAEIEIDVQPKGGN